MWSFFRGCGQLVDGVQLEYNKNNELNPIFGHHPCLLQPLWRGAFFCVFNFIIDILFYLLVMSYNRFLLFES